jgi:hypothetical protein
LSTAPYFYAATNVGIRARQIASKFLLAKCGDRRSVSP